MARIRSKVQEERYQFKAILTYVKEAINEITRTNLYELGLSEEAFKRRLNKRSELKKALKNCTYGSLEDKDYVKDFIKDILRTSYLSEESVNDVIHFNRSGFLSIQDKFEILIHDYKKTHGYDGLSVMISENHLDELKSIIEEGKTQSYIITGEEIEQIYRLRRPSLTYEDKLLIVTQRIYQMYKGFGVVDEIRDMNLDGISGGVSGVSGLQAYSEVMDQSYLGQMTHMPRSYESVWIFYKGKSIHLSFLSFGSDNELRRICQNIYRYNKAGQLSEDKGFKVNEMKDGSRIVVVRPSFSESWAFFVRKFHIANVTLEGLITDPGSDVAVNLLKYLMKGARILSVTGSQGSGKTTLLMAMVREIYATLTLRIQEMAFELHLRNVYPMRNILTFKETDTITGQAGLDVQKKTDGSVNILGEVATDEVAVWMLQMSQVASLFTVFTHHAKTVNDLVLSLRNALLKCDVFRDEKVAEQQVVGILNFDVHLERDVTGKRYISRISEIVAIDQEKPYSRDYRKGANNDERILLFMDTMTDYFTRRTDRKIYRSRNIIEFQQGRYVVTNPMGKKNIKEMMAHMTLEDQQGFKEFLQMELRMAYD